MNDFAQRSADASDVLLPDLELTEHQLIATIRLARVGKLLESIDDQIVVRFGSEGLRSPEDLRTLALIGRSDADGLTSGELLADLGGSKGAMSIRLDRLVEAGLVNQEVSKHDRRSKTNQLTPSGRDLTQRSVSALLEKRATMFASLSPSKVELLGEILGEIIREVNPNG